MAGWPVGQSGAGRLRGSAGRARTRGPKGAKGENPGNTHRNPPAT